MYQESVMKLDVFSKDIAESHGGKHTIYIVLLGAEAWLCHLQLLGRQNSYSFLLILQICAPSNAPGLRPPCKGHLGRTYPSRFKVLRHSIAFIRPPWWVQLYYISIIEYET